MNKVDDRWPYRMLGSPQSHTPACRLAFAQKDRDRPVQETQEISFYYATPHLRFDFHLLALPNRTKPFRTDQAGTKRLGNERNGTKQNANRPGHHLAASQENYYNDVPFGEMLFEGKAGEVNAEDTGSLMDTSINNAVWEYGFPVEFFLDMLCRCPCDVGWRAAPRLSIRERSSLTAWHEVVRVDEYTAVSSLGSRTDESGGKTH